MTKKKIDSLQVLRVFALFGVIFFHSSIIKSASWCLEIFFVLSGFVTFIKYKNETLETSIYKLFAFACNRIKRIYPLHILTMFGMLIFSIYGQIAKLGYETFQEFCIRLIANATLTQSLFRDYSISQSLNYVSWFLSSCFIVYIVYPLFHNIIIKCKNKKDAFLLMILIIILERVLRLVPYVNILFSFTPFNNLFSVLCGSCLAFIHCETEKKDTIIFTVMEIVSLILSITNYIFDIGISWQYLAIIIVYSFSFNKGIVSKFLVVKPLVHIGDLSPYIYLIIPVVNRYVGYITEDLIGMDMHRYGKLAVSIPLSIIASEIYSSLVKKYFK